jgi:hypothetical protein
LLLAQRALAQEVPLTLHWHAPDTCPTEADVLAETRGMVALSRAGATHAVQASVRVQRLTHGRWQASIVSERDGVQGERVLSDPDCAALTHAVALVLALSLGADVLEEAPPAPEPPPPAPSAPPAPAEQEAEVRAPPPAPWQLVVGGELSLGTGLVPRVGYGAGGRVGLERALLGLGLRVGMLAPRHADVNGKASAEATFYAGYLALDACYGSPFPRKWGALGCAGVELAGAHGSSSGVSSPGSALAFWPRVFAALALRAGLPRALALRLEGQLALGLAVPRYAVKGRGSVYEPETLGFRLLLGLDEHF